MRKLILCVLLIILMAIPVFAYFGNERFGQGPAGGTSFGDGAMGEGAAVQSFDAGDALLLTDGSSFFLLRDGSSKLIFE